MQQDSKNQIKQNIPSQFLLIVTECQLFRKYASPQRLAGSSINARNPLLTSSYTE